MSNATNHKQDFVTGWVSSPAGRGTMDIIWGSLFTIALCTWSAICLNIPDPGDSHIRKLISKAKWMLWAIITPDIVLSVAMGQYASARRSRRRFQRLGYPEWTLRHAFFADMGGIILRAPDSPPFVVNSRQLAYLVEKKYVNFPAITSEEIWDKSKADTLARVLTLAQAIWFMVQLGGRATQGLTITTMEIFVVAIVFCTIGVFICWINKPRDVEKGIMLQSKASISQILWEAGDAAAAPYRHTPLDFVAKESFGTWGYDVMGWFNMRCDAAKRPLKCFPNDRIPNIAPIEKFTLFCMTSGFAAIHLAGWNFSFPSHVERLLWRLSSAIVTGTTVTIWTLETIAARQRYGRWDKYLVWLRLKKPRLPGQTDIRNVEIDPDDMFESEQKQAKPMLFWEVLVLLPFVLVYVAARIFMIVEAFSGLRKLRQGAYMTVDFTQILPHW